MTGLVAEMDKELGQKKDLAIKLAGISSIGMTPEEFGNAREAVYGEFAEAFNMSMDEAKHELDARVKLLNPPAQEQTPAAAPKPGDQKKRHDEVASKLPDDLKAMLGAEVGSEAGVYLRLFKKSGRNTTAIVITYVDGTKRTFRKANGTGATWIESVATPETTEPNPAANTELTLPPAAEEALKQ